MTELLISPFTQYLLPLFEKSCQQIYLASLSTLTAILIGVPLGVLVSKKPKLKNLVMGLVNIFQTIPSIAMLAFLIPFLGIGIKPALVTLSLYAILPIVRNTHSGLENIPSDLIKAADGIGFTPSQKLWKVELPIALPIIIAGIRTAAVMSVGIATIAAFIGAGGLGDFIFQGISTDNMTLVLLGAIPAAILALLMDLFFGKVEQLFTTSSHRKSKLSKFKIIFTSSIIILAAALLSIYSGKQYFWANNKDNQIVVATKDFTEQFILGELISQLLEDKSELKVVKKFNLGTTDVCQKAMIRGEIDLYPEYTGTAYLVVLKEQYSPDSSPDDLFHYVDQQYQRKYRIQWLLPFGFNNTQALAVKETFAKEHKLNTISDLTRIDDQLVIAAPPEFISRSDAYPGLKKGYGLSFKEIRQMAPALLYPAIEADHVNVIMAFATDGRLESFKLKTMIDDKNILPHYQAAILIRKEVLASHPEVKTILAPLYGLIDKQSMRKLNYQVEVEKKSPTDVAKSFLMEHNLLNIQIQK